MSGKEFAWSGKVAVITGAGAGLGAALARQAARRGMRLVLADIDETSIEQSAAEFNAAGTQAMAVVADVTDSGAVDALAAEAISRFGQVDLLINNAGIEALGLSWELSPRQWERTLAINVAGPANCIRAFVPHMLASGSEAVIANIGSLASLVAVPYQAAYVASKHALLALAECLDLELRQTGSKVRTCVVLPGTVKTEIFNRASAAGAGAEHRAALQDMLDGRGMPADEAAENILGGIASGAFWISTHPEQMAGAARSWGKHIAALSDPQGLG